MFSTSRYGPKRPLALARLLLLSALAYAAVAALPGAALASTAKITGGHQLQYTAAPGEANDVTITLSGGDYTIQEGGAVLITAQAGCSGFGSVVTCADTGVNRLKVNAKDLDDIVDASSLTVDVLARGGTGDDTLKGGSGRNALAAQIGTATGSQILSSAAGSGPDKLIGSNTKDTITGTGVLKGSSGDDTITANDASTIKGGAGDDTIDADNGASDGVWGDPGNDTIDANDGVVDSIKCGSGGGTATIDWADAPINSVPGDDVQGCTLI